MKLDKEIIDEMVRVWELEKLLVVEMKWQPELAHRLAMQLIRNKEEVVDILNAEYEIEVTRK